MPPKGRLSEHEFCVALKLIALAQNGDAIDLALTTKAGVPLPRVGSNFSAVDTAAPGTAAGDAAVTSSKVTPAAVEDAKLITASVTDTASVTGAAKPEPDATER